MNLGNVIVEGNITYCRQNITSNSFLAPSPGRRSSNARYFVGTKFLFNYFTHVQITATDRLDLDCGFKKLSHELFIGA